MNSTTPPASSGGLEELAPLSPFRWVWRALVPLVVSSCMTGGGVDRLRLMGTLVALLFVGGLLSPHEIVAGLGSEAVVTYTATRALAHAMMHSSIVQKVLTAVMAGAREFPTRARWRLCVVALVISPWVDGPPLVAVLSGVVARYCHFHGMSTAPFLLPMAFAVTLANYTLFANRSNFVIATAMEAVGARWLDVLDVSAVGLCAAPLVLVFVAMAPTWGLIKSHEGQLVTVALRAEVTLDGVTYLSLPTYMKLHETEVLEVRRHGLRMIPSEVDCVRTDDTVLIRGRIADVWKGLHHEGFLPTSLHDEPSREVQKVSCTLFGVVVAAHAVGCGSSSSLRNFERYYGVEVVGVMSEVCRLEEGRTLPPILAGNFLLLFGDRKLLHRITSMDFSVVCRGSDPPMAETLAWKCRVDVWTQKKVFAPCAIVVAFAGVAVGSWWGWSRPSVLSMGALVGLVVGGVVDLPTTLRSIPVDDVLTTALTAPLASAVKNAGVPNVVAAAMGPLRSPAWWAAIGAVAAGVFDEAAGGVVVPIALAACGGDRPAEVMALVVVAHALLAGALPTIRSGTINGTVRALGGYSPRDFVKIGGPLALLHIGIVSVSATLLRFFI